MARTSWTDRPQVVTVRRRWPFVNTLIAAIERFRIHRTGRNSALVAHYGFLSVFPLMLVFTTILGFVLQGNPDLQKRIIDSALANFPFIGSELEANPDHLQGSVGLLIFGLLTALWAGLKAFNVLQMALDDIDDVPIDDRPTLVKVRLQSLLAVVVIGGAQVATAVLSGFVSAAGVQWGNRVLLLLGSISINTLVIAATYHWLGTLRPTWRELAPGAVFAGLAFTVLQLVGTTLMTRAIARASPIYGTFATVIGLLFWLGLHSMIALLGAEMNGVVRLHREGELSSP
jgi:YihY family inner membrane protein